MKTTSLPSVEERKEELRTYFDKLLKPKKPTMKNLDREILAGWLDNVLTQDRDQAYTRLVEEIEGMELTKKVMLHDHKYIVRKSPEEILTDIIENVVKPLYNKTGDN